MRTWVYYAASSTVETMMNIDPRMHMVFWKLYKILENKAECLLRKNSVKSVEVKLLSTKSKSAVL